MAPVGQILASCWRKHANANLAIALSCLALIGIAWAWTLDRVTFERAETAANAIKQNENLALAFEEHTIRTLKGVDQAVLFVKDQHDEHGLKLNIGRMIEKGLLDASLFSFIGITDERGNVVLGSYDFKPTNLADRESFKVHQQNNDNEMFIGKVNLGRITHKWAMPMSHRINKTDGSFGGIVYASVDPEYFIGFYQRANLGEQGAVTLIGLDGIVRARRVGQKSSFGEDMRDANLFVEQAKSRNGSYLGEGKADGVARFVSFRTLAQYPLFVAVGTSEAETMASFHERERTYYMSAGFASTVIVIVAAFLRVALSRRRRAVEALRNNETQLREAQRVAKLGSWERHLDSNTPIWSEELCRIFGRDPKLPVPPFEEQSQIFLPESWERRRVAVEESLRSGAPYELDLEFLRPDGTRGWIVARGEAVRDATGQVTRLRGTAQDVTERKRTEKVLEQSLQRVQALSERVMKIQQEERDGIARELHDELGQTLTALKVNLQMLESYCGDGEAEGHLTEALVITGRALEQVRGMMLDLRPLGLEDLGLAVVLESHLAKQAEAAGWDSQFETTLPGRMRPELKMACFRVAQEALNNVMRHAHAKQVWVALGLHAGEVQLSVRDDGKGFDVALVPDPSPTGGFGLIGMQERVRQMGGRLAIHSAPGRGTEVRASFPCEPAGGREPDAKASAHA